VIEYLNDHHVRADLILSSPAVRAFETARLIAKGIRYPEEKITVMPEIYHFDSAHILRELRGLSNDIQSVMIVGHNPGITQLASHLSGKELEWLPTSAIAGIDFQTDHWDRIGDANVSTRFMIHPKMLP
jgi:phosphohistidine phosphatase